MAAFILSTMRYAYGSSSGFVNEDESQTVFNLRENPFPFLAVSSLLTIVLHVTSGIYIGLSLRRPVAEGVKVVVLNPLLAEWFALAILILVVVTLFTVFGDTLPRRIGYRYSKQIISVSSPLAYSLTFTFYPFILMVELLLGTVFRIKILNNLPQVQAAHGNFKSFVNEGIASGRWSLEQGKMLVRASRFSEKSVSALMTPRNALVWVDASKPLAELWPSLKDSGRSHYPVGFGDKDKIEWVISGLDLAARVASRDQHLDVSQLSKVEKVPVSTSAIQLVQILKASKHEMALVIGEHGGVAGLVTTHDILEGLVGDIYDEKDAVEKSYTELKPGVYLFQGGGRIEEVWELLKFSEEKKESLYSKTLGGFVMEHLGRVPKVGETFELDGYRFKVRKKQKHRIVAVLIERIE